MHNNEDIINKLCILGCQAIIICTFIALLSSDRLHEKGKGLF